MKVGAKFSALGLEEGIHWHINPDVKIEYISSDDKRQTIPWVKYTNLATGKEIIFENDEDKIEPEKLNSFELREVDCIDCHNRPAHVYNNPNKVLNVYISNNKIDRTIPFIKNVGVQALETYARSHKTAKDDISKYVKGFYKSNYPDVALNKAKQLDTAIEHFTSIYKRNYFSEMKVSWKEYPINIGHMHSPGCYRCHDGKHVSKEGKVISNDCKICHTITYQKVPGQEPMFSESGLDFIHPGGVDKITNTKNCVRCHGVTAKQTQNSLKELTKNFR